MQQSNHLKGKYLWLTVFIVIVCVSASTVVLANVISSFLRDDSGAISLAPETLGFWAEESFEASSPAGGFAQAPSAPQNNASHQMPSQRFPKNPDFQAGDDTIAWTTDTQVEIFRVSYENGEQIITVNTDDGNKLVAPGTENSYTFKLKNTGNIALDYTVSIDAYFTPGDVVIPVTGRVSRYDGQWLVGDQNTYAEVTALDRVEDEGTLGAGRYSYYTLDWLWPYESGDDEFDTLIGNMAVNQDLIFTVVVKTVAEESKDPNAETGLKSPQTGDASNTTLWLALSVASFTVSMILIFLPRRQSKTL